MDPRVVGPQGRRANLSELMVARGKASEGEAVNFCPFGCEIESLDESGYCHHLVGFTNDGKTMERMYKITKGVLVGKYAVDGSKIEPVLKTDKLVRITVSSRVYRDVEDAALELATRPGS